MSPETRSRIMRAIKSKNTKPEKALRRACDRIAIGLRRPRKKLPGSPDFVHPFTRLAVFMHGCFWHSCPKHGREPKGREDWARHLAQNRRRDARVRRQLRAMGWAPMVVWEHEDKDRAARRVEARVYARAVSFVRDL